MSLNDNNGKKRRILRAAITLFDHTHNVQRVSLEAIAKEAGVSPATIYNYFGTRENLVVEVARELVREMLEKIRAITDADVPFPRKLAQMVSTKMDFIENNPDILRKLLSQDKFIVSKTMDFSEIADLSNTFFDSGKEQGYIDPSFDNQMLADYFDVLRAGIAAKPELAARIGGNSELVNDFTRLIFYGLMKKDVGTFNK